MISTEEFLPFDEKIVYTASELVEKAIGMRLWKKNCEYDLCPKCRKEFKRFMKNDC